MSAHRDRGASVAWVRVRSSLWPIPLFAVLLAIGVGVAVPVLDAALEGPDGHPLDFVFGGGPSAARDLLAAIAGSLISVTGLVFSLTVVTLQLASSQYSPRLLQTFVSDPVVQAVLATLSATFVYALTVLREVRTESATEGENAFVPRLAITIAYLLALASVLALVGFLGHLARSLRVETMLRDVHDEAREVLARERPQQEGGAGGVPRPPGGTPSVVSGPSGGFVTDVDEDRLARAAAEADAVVVLAARIGDSVPAGVPLAHVWWRGGDEDARGRLVDELHAAVTLEFERSTARDVAYSLRKVVDIVVRALSPGINDPTTAVHGLSHVSALLGELLEHPLQVVERRDGDGVLRVLVPRWEPGDLLELALEEPLHFAGGQPAVLRRLAALLREVAWRASVSGLDDHLLALVEQVCRTARESTSVSGEEAARWRRDVEEALAGRWAGAADRRAPSGDAGRPGHGPVR